MKKFNIAATNVAIKQGTKVNQIICIDSKHEVVRFSCYQCSLTSSRKNDCKTHIESKHKGVHYRCKQCIYEISRKDNLKIFIEGNNEGVQFFEKYRMLVILNTHDEASLRQLI